MGEQGRETVLGKDEDEGFKHKSLGLGKLAEAVMTSLTVDLRELVMNIT